MLQYELFHSVQRFLADEEQLDIQEVSQRAKITLGVISVIVGVACIFAIGFMVHHRKNMVMQLAQSPFLVAMSFCCLISAIFTFTNLPTQDIFCKMRGLLVDFPLTTSAIIVLARAWRVHVTLSNANMFARVDQSKDKCSFGRGLVAVLTFLARLPFRLWHCKDKMSATTAPAKRFNLRQKATAKETVSLIVILAIPDLCLQIVGVTVYNPQLELYIDAESNEARYVCQSEAARSRWVQQFSLAWMVVIFASAVAIAWIGRDLPTAFNEKNAIFNTAAINAVILIVILWLLETNNKANTSPDAVVYLRCANVFGLSISMLANIVMPKIRRVRSGEKVVLTHILAKYNDNQKSQAGDSDDNRRPTALQSTTPDPVLYTAGPTIKLKPEDPLPPSLEKEIYSTLGLLGQVSKLCGEGRTPSASDWHAMRVYVAKLKMELDRVEIDFVDENSTDHLQVATTAGGVRDLLNLNHRRGGGGGGGAATAAAAAGTTNNDLDGVENNDDDGAGVGDDADYDDDDDGDDGSAGS